MRTLLTLALLALAAAARAVNVSAPVGRGSGGVPLLPMSFMQSLHPGFAQSPASLSLSASLLSDSPLQGFREAMSRQGALNGPLSPADTALGLQTAAARFIADYNHVARSASPAEMRRWLAQPAQEERLAVLSAHRGELAASEDPVLVSAIDAAAHYYAFEDAALMRRMESIAAELQGRRRAPQSFDGSEVAVEGAPKVHASGLSRPQPLSEPEAAEDEPPAPVPHGPTDAEFKKAAKTFVGIFLSVVGAAGLWIGAGFLGFVDPTPGVQFLTVYGVELSLSADNLVAFAAILAPVALKTSPKVAQKILQAGLWGALAMRVVASLFGLQLIASYGSLALLAGGAVLVLLAAKMLLPARYSPIHYFEKLIDLLLSPFKAAIDALKTRFAPKHGGKAKFAALGVIIGALLAVAFTDVTFAVDSIPTALGLTHDATVIILANIASVLGLSQLYVILQKMADKFHLVNKGVGFALLAVASKMLLEVFHLWPFGLLLSAAFVMAPILIALALSPFIKPSAGDAHA